jgi:predicted lipoprotein with Yx(FWY)xxD motif
MKKKIHPTLAAVAVGVLTVVLAATALAAPKAQLKTHTTSLGTFLVAGNGSTVYLFEKDKTSKSTCSGSCAKAWPPLLTSGRPTAGSGVKSSLIGTTKRADGTTQVTYHGHPLYLFVGDAKPGATKGEGSKAFGAGWYVVKADGQKIDNDDDGGDAKHGDSR